MTHTTQHTEATVAPALLGSGEQYANDPGLAGGKGKPGVHSTLQYLRKVEE